MAAQERRAGRSNIHFGDDITKVEFSGSGGGSLFLKYRRKNSRITGKFRQAV